MFNTKRVIDFIVLCLRWYLAFYMISYGYSKLCGGQFGLFDEKYLDYALKDINDFYLSWYLFGKSQFFNVFVGSFQILISLLLMFNRTALLGAILLLPLLFQILLIDILFTTDIFGVALPLRLSIMILCDLAILFYYRKEVLLAFNMITKNISTKYRYYWWQILLLPIVGFILDFIFAFISYPLKMLINYLIYN